MTFIRFIVFWGLFAVSAFLSWNLYTGLVLDGYDKLVIGIVAVAMEGLMILTLTLANQCIWQWSQHKKRLLGKDKKDRDIIVLGEISLRRKALRNAVVLYIIYGIMVFLSSFASFGWILTTVDRSQEVSITIGTDSLNDTLVSQINILKGKNEQDNAKIEMNRSQVTSFNQQLLTLDVNLADYAQQSSSMRNKINRIFTENNVLLAEMASNSQKITSIQSDIDIGKKADAKIQNAQQIHKNMYQLIDEVLHVGEKNIRFFLLGLLALMIQVGIFLTSPHIHRMEEEETKGIQDKGGVFGKLTDLLFGKNKEEINIVETQQILENLPAMDTESDIEIDLDSLRNMSSKRSKGKWSHLTTKSGQPRKRAPYNLQQKVSVEPDIKVDIEEQKLQEPMQEEPLNTAVEVPVEASVPDTIFDNLLEPELKEASDLERFLSGLWVNGMGKALPQAKDVADNLGILRLDASRFFELLEKAHLIDFRNNLWYPSVTLEGCLEVLKNAGSIPNGLHKNTE